MPYLLFYADKKDLKTIEEYLNQHPEIAFIVPDGLRRWRAVQAVTGLRRTSVALWHVPSGPLPLLHPAPSDKESRILDPWKGWKELRRGADRSSPYFGPDDRGVIWLNRRALGTYKPGNIGMSSFGWIGNYYSRAKKATEAYWKELRRWVKENATLIPRSGKVNGPRRDIWAFPSALAAFKQGQGRDPDWM